MPYKDKKDKKNDAMGVQLSGRATEILKQIKKKGESYRFLTNRAIIDRQECEHVILTLSNNIDINAMCREYNIEKNDLVNKLMAKVLKSL